VREDGESLEIERRRRFVVVRRWEEWERRGRRYLWPGSEE
jgi:hypothetical protein